MRQNGLILVLAVGRVRSKKKKGGEKTQTNPAVPKTHHEIHSIPATATISRRRAMNHVPRGRPHSPASIDPRLVEIGLVQLSHSVGGNRPRTGLAFSKNDECYTLTQTHTPTPTV